MKIANGNVCRSGICRSYIEFDRALFRDAITHSEIAMKIKRIVSALLSIALIYGALILIIAGGFAVSMGFAMAPAPIAPNLVEVRKDNPSVMLPDHPPVAAVPEAEPSTARK